MTFLLGGGLLLKPALTLSQLAIDVDKSWQELDTPAHSPAWEPTLFSWNDRKRITITGSVDGPLTPHRKQLTVHYGAGVDAGSDIYLDSKCLPDFADIRFTNNAGAPLFYWVESYTYGVSAQVWVRFDSIPASPATADFWVYFNNGLAISASYGDGTFIVFDDFERGNNGDEVGGAWTGLAGVTHISTVHDIGDIAGYLGTRGLLIGGGGAASAASIPNPVSVNKSINFKFYKEAASEMRIFHGNGANIVDIIVQGADVNLYYYDTALRDTGKDITPDAWQTLEFRNCDFAAGTYDIYLNGVLAKAGAAMTVLGWYPNAVSLENWDVVVGHETWFDNFIVRNWTPNEPTFSAYGPDEPHEIFCGITSLKELAAAMIKGDMLFSDGAKLARIASGSIGSIFTTHDVGADPTWTYPP